jgi:hypothetical protein
MHAKRAPANHSSTSISALTTRVSIIQYLTFVLLSSVPACAHGPIIIIIIMHAPITIIITIVVVVMHAPITIVITIVVVIIIVWGMVQLHLDFFVRCRKKTHFWFKIQRAESVAALRTDTLKFHYAT